MHICEILIRRLFSKVGRRIFICDLIRRVRAYLCVV